MARIDGRYFMGAMADRRHVADGIAAYCKYFVTSGVTSLGSNLQVTAGGGMTVNINYGTAFVDGYLFGMHNNGTGLHQLTLPNADAQPRIDRIVIRKDASAVNITINVKTGVPAASPTAPALERSNGVYEISLAKVSVSQGASVILSSNIDDERASSDVCGIVASAVDPPAPNITVDHGSWVPRLYGSTTAGNPTYAGRLARYVRIDNFVYVHFYISLSSKGGMVGSLRISDLPYLVYNGTYTVRQHISGTDISRTGINSLVALLSANDYIGLRIQYESSGSLGEQNCLDSNIADSTNLYGAFMYYTL